MRVITIATATAIALTAAACGGGGGGTELEGIYTIDAWNDNPDSCADPGMDVLPVNSPLFFVKHASLLGHGFIAVDACDDVATCTATANEPDNELGLAFSQFVLDEGNDDDGWTGRSGFYSSTPDVTTGTCDGVATYNTLTADGAAAITVRSENRDVPSFPANGDECRSDEMYEVADALPCSRQELAHATFMVEL